MINRIFCWIGFHKWGCICRYPKCRAKESCQRCGKLKQSSVGKDKESFYIDPYETKVVQVDGPAFILIDKS